METTKKSIVRLLTDNRNIDKVNIGDIVLNLETDTLILINNKKDIEKVEDDISKGHRFNKMHLFIASKEKIKENDLILYYRNTVTVANSEEFINLEYFIESYNKTECYRKIIASTNLSFNWIGNIPKNFIELFIEKYNNSKTTILEYIYVKYENDVVKINKDNEIEISLSEIDENVKSESVKKVYLFIFDTNYEEGGIIIVTDKGEEYAKQKALEFGMWDNFKMVEINTNIESISTINFGKILKNEKL